MSNVRFSCPSCQARLSIDSGSTDLVVECPTCHQAIRAWGAPLLDIRFRCPECNSKLLIDAQAAGRRITCPECQKTVTVPTPFERPGSPPSPREQTDAKARLLSEDEVKFLSGDI